MLDRLRRLMPSQESLHNNRWLRWIGPRLYHPRLWHISRRGIALGVSIGVFFGFLIPIAQIPFSAATAVALRANVPAAMASTLVTNPITFPPVYYAAWRVGEALIGPDGAVEPPVSGPSDLMGGSGVKPPAGSPAPQGSWLERTWQAINSVGKPLVTGLVLFAVCGSIGMYLLVNAIWHLRVRLKRRARLRRAMRRA